MKKINLHFWIKHVQGLVIYWRYYPIDLCYTIIRLKLVIKTTKRDYYNNFGRDYIKTCLPYTYWSFLPNKLLFWDRGRGGDKGWVQQ